MSIENGIRIALFITAPLYTKWLKENWWFMIIIFVIWIAVEIKERRDAKAKANS